MAEQLAAFQQARFCGSSALTNEEFLATVAAYDERNNIAAGSGASELARVLEILQSRAPSSSPLRASPFRPVLTLRATEGLPERVVRTLSPSDKQYQLFLGQLASLLPKPLRTKIRIPDQSPNNISVALHVAIGDQQGILLGADLEERNDPELGWSAIVSDENRPNVRAQIFKMPHHGSLNGHCAAVWSVMLVSNPIAIVTPWRRNKGLPTQQDTSRIAQLTHSAFCTSSAPSQKRKRPHSVEKQIKETVGQLRPAQLKTGWVRLRTGGSANPALWSLDFSDEACPIGEYRWS